MPRKPPISARLRRRAEQIINSDAYEQDTRDAVKQALKEGDAGELAETVRSAERGEHICDTTIIDRAQLRQAKLVVAFLNSSAPDFITTAAAGALQAAAHLKRLEIWRAVNDGCEEYDPRAIADLFAILGPTFSLPVEAKDPRQEAASLLAKLINDASDLPDFCTLAIMDMLMLAASSKGVNIMAGDGSLDQKGLADLFAVTSGTDFTHRTHPRAEAAALLSRLVKHKGLPADLRHEIGQLITEGLMGAIDQDAPEMLAAALELYARA